MLSSDLVKQLHNLNRADKLRVIQLLVGDLASEEEVYLTTGATYEVWSPYDAPDAAATLLTLLDDDETQHG